MFGLGGIGFSSYTSYQHRLRVYRAIKTSKTNKDPKERQQETEDDMIEKDSDYAIISKILEEPCFITLHLFVNRMAIAETDQGKMLLAYDVKPEKGRDPSGDHKVQIVNSWLGDVQKKEDKMKFPEFLIDVSKIVSAAETYKEYSGRNGTIYVVCKCTCLYTQGMSSSTYNIIEPVEEIRRLIEEATTKKLEKIMEMTKKLRALHLEDNSTQQETEGL